MPRELIHAPDHERKRSLGWLGWAWIEHFCIHGPGDVQGISLDPNLPDSLPLDDEFGGFIVDCYAHDEKGRRLYDDAFISRAKGRAKSELAAFEALFEAFGPCRFAGFAEGGEVYRQADFTYTYQPGEPMGRPVTYPFIRCLATEESQSGNTYDNIFFNLEEGPLVGGSAEQRERPDARVHPWRRRDPPEHGEQQREGRRQRDVRRLRRDAPLHAARAAPDVRDGQPEQVEAQGRLAVGAADLDDVPAGR